MINGIVTKIAALIDTALPLYSRSDAFFTPIKDIDGGDFPVAMVYDPTVVSVRLRDRQNEQTFTILATLIRKHSEATEIRDDLDAVVAAINADPTLTASVDDIRVESWGSAERQTSHTIGGLILEAKLVQ